MSLIINSKLGRFWREFLALLLVGAVLLCHGVLWASHACSDTQVSSAGSQAFGSHLFVDKGAAEHEQTGCYSRIATDHFAVLLTAFFGLIFLGLLSGTARSWIIGDKLRVFGRRPRTYAFNPPRGPTLPLIQVFRL